MTPPYNTTLSQPHRSVMTLGESYFNLPHHVDSTRRTFLPWTKRLSYGVGHVLNDVTTSMWFTYSLVYFTDVLLFDSHLAGFVMMVGQITDGLSTVLVGIYSDRGDGSWVCIYGKRKIWHLLGAICIFIAFPFIFTPCVGCHLYGQGIQVLYYCSFACAFQFGCAAVQISHLSLVPDLTSDNNERTCLLSLRYAFGIIASIVVYVTMWLVLKLDINTNAPVSPNDAHKFQLVAYLVLCIGIIAAIIFHLGVKEQTRGQLARISAAKRLTVKPARSSLKLFGNFSLYKIGVVFVMARVFYKVTQAIFTQYISHDLHLGRESIAILPMVAFAFSFAMSIVIGPINRICGNKVSYCFGSTVGIGASVCVWFGAGEIYREYFIYAVSGLYGVGAAFLIVTSLSITVDLIGDDAHHGSFIFGLFSFSDKICNGVVLMMIQTWGNYRGSLTFVCGAACVTGALFCLWLPQSFLTDTVDAPVDQKSEISQGEDEDSDTTSEEMEVHYSLHK